MIRTIYWYIHFVVTLLAITPNLKKLKRLKPKISAEQYNKTTEEIVSKWAKSQMKTSGSSIKVTGLGNIPKDEAVLFVSNHQSNFDIALFMSYIRIPKGFVAKIEMLKVPLLRTWMRNMRCVFLDRNDLRQSAQTIIDGIGILKSGQSLVVFPEGTRSKGPNIGEFKSGAFKLATKSKVKIIPVSIDGSYKIMEANNNKIKPAKVKMVIHPAIDTSALSKDEQSHLSSTVKQIIQNSLSS